VNLGAGAPYRHAELASWWRDQDAIESLIDSQAKSCNHLHASLLRLRPWQRGHYVFLYIRGMKLPYTGRMLAAARMLAGLEQQELAKQAKVSASTISRLEACGSETVTAHPKNIEAVLTVLERKGVVIEEDGIRLKSKRR
jgi:hypothetical protein